MRNKIHVIPLAYHGEVPHQLEDRVITKEELIEMGACPMAIVEFDRFFPSGETTYLKLREKVAKLGRNDYQEWLLKAFGGDYVITSYGMAAITGNHGEAVSTDIGCAISGRYGKSTSCKTGVAITGEQGVATAGDGGLAVANGNHGRASAGKGGIAIVSPHGWAKADKFGVLIFRSHDFSVCVQVGTDGVKPNCFYRLNSGTSKIEEVPKDLLAAYA